ncbi:MAG: efflux RND transporter periplasmic adaptor subunit [Opitutaceae bacterium]|nr:efflux RND transporter periplasmic adaptor subunit [Verrucomicrobiales bacterium]
MNLPSLKIAVLSWCRQRPRLVAALGGGLVLLSILALRGFGKNPAEQFLYYPVKRSDFMISIVEGGTLKAVHEVTVRSEMEGQARILSIVAEGTVVKKGDLLVELDSSDLRDRIAGQEVTFQTAQFAFIQAKEALSIQKSLIESNIKEAELKVEFAKSDLEKYKEGDWPQTEKTALTKITIASEELNRAKERYNYTVILQKKGYATKTELDTDALTVKRNEIGTEAAKEDLRLLQKYDYPKRVRLLESNVEQAAKELERLKLRSAAQVSQYEADLRTRQTTLDLQENRLNQLKEQLALTRIMAPQDGLVIYASSSYQGNVLIEEGATVRQKQDIIKLPDTSSMMVEIRVHESHVQKIKPGLAAFVSIDALPDQQFRGYVRKVAVLPDSSSRFYNPNLKVYSTEILIDDEIPDLKPGISGRAEVVITNLVNVLTVPIQAVTTVKGQQVCYVESSSGSKPVPVEVGMYNDRLIEIKSGLKEGDRVLLSPLSSSDGISLSGSVIDENTSSNLPPPKVIEPAAGPGSNPESVPGREPRDTKEPGESNGGRKSKGNRPRPDNSQSGAPSSSRATQ